MWPKMQKYNGVYQRAYSDLTAAMARAKQICRNHSKYRKTSLDASTLQKGQIKRGRPKGSKDSKPRNTKHRLTSTHSCSGLSSSGLNVSIFSQQLSSNEQSIEIPNLNAIGNKQLTRREEMVWPFACNTSTVSRDKSDSAAWPFLYDDTVISDSSVELLEAESQFRGT